MFAFIHFLHLLMNYNSTEFENFSIKFYTPFLEDKEQLDLLGAGPLLGEGL